MDPASSSTARIHVQQSKDPQPISMEKCLKNLRKFLGAGPGLSQDRAVSLGTVEKHFSYFTGNIVSHVGTAAQAAQLGDEHGPDGVQG